MRVSILLLSLAIPGLTACVEGAGMGGSGPGAKSVTEQCVIRAARAVGKPTNQLPVLQALSYPEGDIVTVDVPGQGKIRCTANVDGALGELVWIEGGPARPAATAPATRAAFQLR